MRVHKESQPPQHTLKSQSLSLKQSLMGACTNIVYRIGAIGGLKRMPHILRKVDENGEVIILGESFPDCRFARQKFNQLIWFTYREKLKLTEDLNSDVGWGCLPRVGQMLLAQALFRFFSSRGETANKNLYTKIIEPFLDGYAQESNYSLSSILKYARWKFSINPGQWFNIGQISEVLRKLQDDNPLKGSEDLKLLFFSQSVIFVDELYSKGQVPKCTCAPKINICPLCHSQLLQTEKQGDRIKHLLGDYEIISAEEQVIQFDSEGQEKEQQYHHTKIEKPSQSALKMKKAISCTESMNTYHRLNKHILLIVSVRVSEKTITKEEYDCLLELLDLPQSLGIVGGVPSKALYIVGHSQKEAIYLDPHYVQQYVDKKNFENNLGTFFCSQFRTIDRSALDPSMAFCFYLKSLEDIVSMLNKLQEIKQSWEHKKKSPFISVMQTNDLEQQLKNNNIWSESPENDQSYEYNSLEFRDISDSI